MKKSSKSKEQMQNIMVTVHSYNYINASPNEFFFPKESPNDVCLKSKRILK